MFRLLKKIVVVRFFFLQILVNGVDDDCHDYVGGELRVTTTLNGKEKQDVIDF